MTEQSKDIRAGFVAILGKPNVGKSTLLNAFLGERVAITTPKPQTTRNQIRGILNRPGAQIVFVDTPGIPIRPLPEKKRAFQDYLTEEALGSLEGVDVLLFVVDAHEGLRSEDLKIWEMLKQGKKGARQCFVVLNKADLLGKQSETLLPLIEKVSAQTGEHEIFPCSAQSKKGLEELLKKIETLLPMGPALYPDDQLSDQNDRFMAAEMIREQLFLNMGEEIPYSIAVEVEQFKEEENLLRINAVVYVERDSQKGMVIGKQGRVLKKVGSEARQNMEKFFGKKIFLEMFVKVLTDWTTNQQLLARLGYQSKNQK